MCKHLLNHYTDCKTARDCLSDCETGLKKLIRWLVAQAPNGGNDNNKFIFSIIVRLVYLFRLIVSTSFDCNVICLTINAALKHTNFFHTAILFRAYSVSINEEESLLNCFLDSNKKTKNILKWIIHFPLFSATNSNCLAWWP